MASGPIVVAPGHRALCHAPPTRRFEEHGLCM